ncbi:acetyltransferase, putative [Roseobacter sp. SK209-2-6]|uniref:GNAT family N-acetyltransferase n=1 Tax=Roseobacter sp. SK209-2-6 TaxID=388739 RepID=UPI0000F3C805|nr:acetyltransferase, putative [Roseobacter sp. SK209-2-6]
MYIIELAKPRDAHCIAKIHVSCWQECYSFLPRGLHEARNEAVRSNQWTSRLNHQVESKTLVLRDAGIIAGFAHITKNGDKDMPGIAAELHACYLLPGYRGTLAGPQMMLEMLNCAKDEGWDSFSVWAWKRNPIRRTYEALGLKRKIMRDREICGYFVPEVGYCQTDISETEGKLLKNLTHQKRRAYEKRSRQRCVTHRLRFC